MKLRNNKGSITIFVLIGLLFMSGFLIISYGNNINKSKISKEQLNILSGIYSKGDSDGDAYNRAYTDLRKENSSLISKTGYSSSITLTNTLEEKISNYRIDGSVYGLGIYNISTGRYEIQIKVTDKNGDSETYPIYLLSPLKKSGTLVDYIDYKNQKVVRKVDTTTEEAIYLPDIYAYEDYTKIQITGGTPSKIELEYVGYEFIS